MKRQAIVLAMAFLLVGAALAQVQTAFKIPFEFKAGGKNLPKGDYTLSKTPEGGFLFKQDSTGRETPVAALERIAQPVPPLAEPRLVFDEVGDFAPSYTEYITVYVLSEVWLPGEDGYRVHVTKGAHKTKVVNGLAAK